jgi:uncharacterized coiled-coil protein SlyX
MMHPLTPDERMDELESRLALLQDDVDSLNATIIQQAKTIDALLMAVHDLHQKPNSGSLFDKFTPSDEKPPHY